MIDAEVGQDEGGVLGIGEALQQVDRSSPMKAVSSVPARSVAWVPVSSGTSFAAVIVTVVVPVAVAAPSGPWAPVLPSENVQASVTDEAGASEVLA